jgi:hypothetical protein
MREFIIDMYKYSEMEDENRRTIAQSRAEVTRHPPKRRALHAIRANEGEYMCDIVFPKYAQDAKSMKKANGGNTCILVVMEIRTRFVYVRPMKTKGAREVCETFREIYTHIINDEARSFNSLTHDAGSEFDNELWHRLLREILPRSFLDENDEGALLPVITEHTKEPQDRFSMGIIDRFCLTLKTWIEEWQIAHDSLSWRDALVPVVARFNAHDMTFAPRDKFARQKNPKATEDIRTSRGFVRLPNARAVKISPINRRIALQRKSLVGHADPLVRISDAADEVEQSRDAAGLVAFASFALGDHVRIRLSPRDQPRDKSTLTRGPGKNAKGVDRYSNKVYEIVFIRGNSFGLRDTKGKDAQRTYRAHELMKVAQSSIDVPDVFKKPASEARRERRRKHT